MDVLTAKIIAMIVLGGASLLLGLFPMLLKRCCLKDDGGGKSKSGNVFLSALSCFGGGVILATSITHMLPEVNLMLSHNIEQGDIPNTGSTNIRGT